MSMSIRNQLRGTVAAITEGAAMATVTVRLTGGQEITAAVTLDAVRELDLAVGSPVEVLVKATEVALANGPVAGLSIRNQLPGTVTGVSAGPAMAVVRLNVAGGELTAAITSAAAAELALADGSPVVALIKATEVALAVG